LQDALPLAILRLTATAPPRPGRGFRRDSPGPLEAELATDQTETEDVRAFKDELERRNPHEPEFRQADVAFGPGKAANAGGVAVSGLEQSQNSLRMRWSREEVHQRLQDIMETIHETCVEYGAGADGRVDYVKGANIGGFVRVADAMVAQGAI
jgi:hypothetical protein